MTTLDQLESCLSADEGSHLEFKEAKQNFHFEELVKYCAALANEGGGRIVLGVTDKKPRRVVGSQAFADLERTKQGLIDRLHLRFDAQEFQHRDGRVLIFTAPPRPIGMPIQYQGAYWMRSGDSLAPMTPDMLKRIFAESGPDFSAEVCGYAVIGDLVPASIEDFRSRWIKKSGNQTLKEQTDEQLLADAELILDGQITYAALILFGSRTALGKHLAQSELIFEYRSTEASVPFQQRLEFRQGFFSFYDELWNTINLRNDRQSYQDGLFRYDIPTFSEGATREAILNAVGHRDYRLGGSTFVKQFPRHLEIINPGGFPHGITRENILDHQNPRNRRLSEAFAKCGLIERSGQGMNRIFEETIRQSKPLPDFSGSDDHHVRLVLRGDVQDPAFIKFIEKVGEDRLATFTTRDFLVLSYLQREQAVAPDLRERLPRLIELGVVECLGRGRGARYMLSRALYAHLGQRGTYTRKKGLDHETNKELLLRHLRDNFGTGSALAELCQVLPSLSESAVQRLLTELKEENRVRLEGSRRWARWFAIQAKAQNG
ncbi:MAG: putative DNA binding domain-containing protein [Verrucomicrobiales bacterium]|nr:putative DNA binding domain-containing protein [Verrucomicrobiales bacterium]